MKVFLLLLGFYTTNAFATILGQTGDWDILVAGVVVAAIEGIRMLMYKKPPSLPSRRLQSLVSMVNYWKAGIVLGLFVDAFKLALRGAAALKARFGYKNILNGGTPVLPIEDSKDYNFNYEKCRTILSNGAKLYIEKSDGRIQLRSGSIILNTESMVFLRSRKPTMLNAFSTSCVRYYVGLLD